MEAKRIVRWKVWGGWEPEKIERWLEEQEAAGWQLESAGFSALRFTFVQGPSRKVSYCVDYQNGVVDKTYQQLFIDLGWKLVYQGAGWYIWSKPYDKERPEIFTDSRSLIDRNKRVLTLMLLVISLQLPALTRLLHVGESSARPTVQIWMIAAYAALLGLIGFSTYKLLRSNLRLSKQHNKQQ